MLLSDLLLPVDAYGQAYTHEYRHWETISCYKNRYVFLIAVELAAEQYSSKKLQKKLHKQSG